MPPPIDNPFLDSIEAQRRSRMPEPSLKWVRYRTPGDDIGPTEWALAPSGTWESETASARAAIDRAADRAGTAPGGYNPDADIMELRGGHKALTSAYGVGHPSNDVLRQYHAGREVADRENTKVAAVKTQADAIRIQADAEKAKVDWEKSPEKFKQDVLAHGIQSNDPNAQAKGAEVGGFASPAQKLVGAGVAPSVEKLPKDVDAAIRALQATGKGPLKAGDPTRAAFEQQFGEPLRARVRGEPLGLLERRLLPGLTVQDALTGSGPAVVRGLFGMPDERARNEAAVRAMFPRAEAADATPLPTQEAAGPAPAAPERPVPGVRAPRQSLPVGLPSTPSLIRERAARRQREQDYRRNRG